MDRYFVVNGRRACMQYTPRGILSTMTTSSLCIRTPLGYMVVSGTGEAVEAIRFVQRPQRRSGAVSEALEKAAEELLEYFQGKRREFDIYYEISGGTEFQRAVWEAIRAIPHGETRTYGDIAAQIGHTKAVRAVGTAVGDNPLCILCPCHRVVPQSNSQRPGNYAAGAWRKAWLLEQEAAGSIA